MKLLVTGGAGFIGSHYVRTMLSGGYPGWEDAVVTVVDKLTYAGDRRNLPASHPRLVFVHGDICDGRLLDRLLLGHRAVVHFAAESHVDRSLTGSADFVRSNVGGTQMLLEASQRAAVQVVVHVSTDEVYGSIAEGSWTEREPLLPNSLYAATKAGADLVARAYWRSHGLDVRTTRCSNNYGPYQHVEKLIPRFVTRLLKGRPVPLYGDGANVREWLHVDDHCRAVQRVLEDGRAGEIYNIGSGEAMSNRQMTELLLKLCGAGWEMVRHVPDRLGHDLRYSVDDRKIRAELGWRPRRNLAEGLAETVAWYRDNADRWRSAEDPD
ncbi:dTDP-glucose 4,6-dehydratase [Micromonosporaceae bacterium B7E4]